MPGVRQADLTTLQQDGNQIKDVHPRLVLHCNLSVISLLTAVQMPPWNGCHWPKKKKTSRKKTDEKVEAAQCSL